MFTNIVWATDGSEHADRALVYATQLAQRDGAALQIVHIVEKILGSRAAGQNVHADEPEIQDKINQQAAELRSQHGLEAHLHMPATPGNVAVQIAAICRDTGSDLIVVGTRGHSALAGTILGSVTQRLLHIAHCPVLAVPPLGHKPTSADAADELITAS